MNTHTLKNVLRVCTVAVLLGVLSALSTAPSHGQTIVEDETYKRDSSDKWFGKLSAVGANGSSHQATYQALEIGYDTPFSDDNGRFYFSGIATNTDLELDLELRQSSQNDPNDDRPRTRTQEEDESDLDVRDAFIQYDLPGDLVFTLGRRRVAWGQFELVSPVNLALPLTPQTAEPVASKINTLVPQDQVALSWFPGERTEVQAYYFFNTNVDWLIEEVVSGDATERTYTGTNLDEPQPADRRDLEDHSAYAARVLFYRDWGTIGLTYHKGRDALALNSDNATLQCNSDDAFDRSVCPNDQAINVRRHTDLPEAENYGLEISIPSGQWVWKFELLRQETTTDLEGFSIPGDAAGGARDFLNRVITENGGRLFVPVDRTYIAIGADSDRDKWRFNLSLLALQEDFDNPSLIDDEEREFGSDRGTVVFPAINIARYIAGDKQREVGFVGGFLGAYAGVSLYYASHRGDNFRWVAGVEAASNLRNDLVAENNPDNDRYELADDLSAGVRVSLIYDF